MMMPNNYYFIKLILKYYYILLFNNWFMEYVWYVIVDGLILLTDYINFYIILIPIDMFIMIECIAYLSYMLSLNCILLIYITNLYPLIWDIIILLIWSRLEIDRCYLDYNMIYNFMDYKILIYCSIILFRWIYVGSYYIFQFSTGHAHSCDIFDTHFILILMLIINIS